MLALCEVGLIHAIGVIHDKLRIQPLAVIANQLAEKRHGDAPLFGEPYKGESVGMNLPTENLPKISPATRGMIGVLVLYATPENLGK
jgi:hypothetical protein